MPNDLTPEQTLHAILAFYKRIPADLWEEDARPTTIELESVVVDAQDDLPDAARDALDTWMDPANVEGQALVARRVLDAARADPQLAPLVDAAIAEATTPHMVPLPIIVGVVVVALGVLTIDTGTDESTVRTKGADGAIHTEHRKKFHLKFNLDKLAGVVGNLASLVKELPKA